MKSFGSVCNGAGNLVGVDKARMGRELGNMSAFHRFFLVRIILHRVVESLQTLSAMPRVVACVKAERPALHIAHFSTAE